MSELPYERVEQACLELFKRGESISVAKIHSLVGHKGPPQSLADMVRRWQENSWQRLQATERDSPLPDALLRATDHWLGEVWQLAQNQALQVQRQHSEAWARQEALWRIELDTAHSQLAQLEQDQKRWQQGLRHSAQLLAHAQQAEQSAQQQQQGLQQRLQELEREQHSLGLQLTETQAALLAERKRHESALRDLHTQQEQERRRALAHADHERRQLLQQIDTLKQEQRLQNDQWRLQLENAFARAHHQQHQAQMAREESLRQRQRIDSLQAEIATLLAEGAHTREESLRWKTRAEQLSGQDSTDQAAGLRDLMSQGPLGREFGR